MRCGSAIRDLALRGLQIRVRRFNSDLGLQIQSTPRLAPATAGRFVLAHSRDMTQSEFAAVLDHHDALVRQCASGRLPFWDFCAAYDNFYWSCALDGHEADAAGRTLLATYADRIAPHRVLAETILAHVCSDANAESGSYGKSGRFGPEEAMARLRQIVSSFGTTP